ncbi:MAG: TonB C-terminal domain-containing protein [Cyanobacteria bacterium SZAS LIN-3]|nr:TonB C-terminal domain-containing protein [Cyanobacteria bacterium SZAS LIN-3]
MSVKKEESANAGLIIAISVMLLGIVLVGAPMLVSHQSASPGPESERFGRPVRAKPAGSGSRDGDTATSNATANNTAVDLMKEGKVEAAIDILEPLVQTAPDYVMGRENLAIAYNNLALQKSKNPRVALDAIWRSYCLAPEVGSTAENASALLERLHVKANSFDERRALADTEKTNGCLYGAYAEYKAALAIKDDAAVRAKLDEVIHKAQASSDDDVNGAFFVKVAERAATAGPEARETAVDFGSYMAGLQRSIKQHWRPSRTENSRKTVVKFTVGRDGEISHARVLHSSGDKDQDQAALDALTDLGRAEPLPAGSPPAVEIEFTFDYNVFKKGEKI